MANKESAKAQSKSKKLSAKNSTAIESGRQMVDQAMSYVEKETIKHPYATLGAAVSIGYLFGQGWLRATLKLGFAFLVQEAARRVLPDLSLTQQNDKKVIH